MMIKNCWTTFPFYYKEILSKAKSVFGGNLDNNEACFKDKEVEVFKLIK